MQEVTGSSPVPSTIQFVLEPDSLRKRVRVRFLFIGGFAARVCRAVNEQRQGITMTVVSCLLCYMARLRVIAAHVRTGRACTPLARCNSTLDFVPKFVCQGAKPLRIPAERVRTYAEKWQNFTISGCSFMVECGILGLAQ